MYELSKNDDAFDRGQMQVVPCCEYLRCQWISTRSLGRILSGYKVEARRL